MKFFRILILTTAILVALPTIASEGAGTGKSSRPEPTFAESTLRGLLCNWIGWCAAPKSEGDGTGESMKSEGDGTGKD